MKIVALDLKIRDRLFQGSFFFILLTFAFQAKHKIFKSLASRAVSGFDLPPAFQKSFYFYLTDLGLIAIAALLFSQRESLRALFFTGSRKYLTCLFFAAFISIIFSSMASSALPYVRLMHLALIFTFFAALESGAIFQDLKTVFPRICQLILIISLIECAVGLAQYFSQGALGLRFLGEGKAHQAFSSSNGLWIFGSHSESRSIIRAMGTFGHPNIFGGFMFVATMMGYYLFWQSEERRMKILYGSAIFFQMIALVLSFSRAALFAFALANLVWFCCCFWARTTRQKSRTNLLFVLAIILFSAALFLPMLKDRGGVVNYNRVSRDSDNGRIYFQNIALSMIKAHPVTGVGLGQYVAHVQEFAPAPLTSYQFFPVHNIFLFVTAETGVIGLLCFLLFIGSILRKVLKAEMTLPLIALLSTFAGLLFIGCCDFYLVGEQHGKILFFTIAGLLSLQTGVKKRISVI